MATATRFCTQSTSFSSTNFIFPRPVLLDMTELVHTPCCQERTTVHHRPTAHDIHCKFTSKYGHGADQSSASPSRTRTRVVSADASCQRVTRIVASSVVRQSNKPVSRSITFISMTTGSLQGRELKLVRTLLVRPAPRECVKTD